MNRRAFFRLVALAAVTTAVNPERLLWTPGQRTHILPPPQGWRPTPPLAFHPLAFSFTMEPLWPDIYDQYELSEAAKAMARKIDVEIERLWNTSLPTLIVTGSHVVNVEYSPEVRRLVDQAQEMKRDLLTPLRYKVTARFQA